MCTSADSEEGQKVRRYEESPLHTLGQKMPQKPK